MTVGRVEGVEVIPNNTMAKDMGMPADFPC